ncbi:protogenin B-like [Antedon mediterranea]|uniref:protogenin B-like n=1 Tax=Antedon mediterranea TaxID=105859 RepID=UPI003AF432B5
MAILTDVIVYLCSVLVLSLTGVSSQLDIQFDVQDVVALRKHSAYINCKVSGQDALTGNIIWLKNRKQLDNEDSNIETFPNGTLYFAMARQKAAFSDSGLYQCCLRILNSSSQVCSQDVTFSIAKMPKLSKARINLNYKAGQAVRLTCPTEAAVPRPIITWYRDKKEIIQDDRVVVLSSGVLHLLSLHLDDAGRYRCKAANIAGQRNGPIITLNVTSSTSLARQPVIVSNPKDVRMVAGRHVELECLFEGPSNMNVTWTRTDGHKIRNPTYTGRRNLILQNVIQEDSGNYVCSAQVPGTLTVVSKHANVDIITLPLIKTAPLNASMKRWVTQRFYCVVQGDSSTTITWIKDGQILEIQKSPEANDLVLYHLEFENAGIYQCLASNDAGSVQKSAKLVVIGDPKNRPQSPYQINTVSTSSTHIMVMWLDDPEDSIIATTIYIQQADGDEDSKRQEVVKKSEHTMLIDNLKPYTNYSIYMVAFTEEYASFTSDKSYMVTEEAVPSRYPDFQLQSSYPLNIDVSWKHLVKNQRNGIVTNYKIVYKSTATKEMKEIIVNGTQLFATITNLQPDTEYQIRMAAATKIGFGVFSDWIQCMTLDNLTAPPLSLKNPNFYNLTNTSVALKWETVGVGEIKGFELRVRMKNNEETLFRHQLPPQTQEFVLNKLKPKTKYLIFISVISGNVPGSPTVIPVTTKDTSLTVTDDHCKLPWPRDIVVSTINYDSFEIQWKAPQTAFSVKKYRFRYRSVDFHDSFHFTEVNHSREKATIITGLQPYTNYMISVQTVGACGESEYSAFLDIKTKEHKPQTPPADLRAKPIDAHSVEISWEPPQKPNGIITEYIILYNINNTSPEKLWDKQQRNGSETLSNVNNLLSNTEYFFRMKAKNQIGMSPATDMVSARTLTASDNEGLPNRFPGILLGVGISVFCIVACIISFILIKRNGNRQSVQNKPDSTRRNVGNGETPVVATGGMPRPTAAQTRPVANFNHLIMYQNKQRQFGNNAYYVPCHSNSAGGSGHDPDDEVPLSVRLLSGEFDHNPELMDEAQEEDPMLPNERTTDTEIKDDLENNPIPLVADTMASIEGVQAEDSTARVQIEDSTEGDQAEYSTARVQTVKESSFELQQTTKIRNVAEDQYSSEEIDTSV